MLGLGLQAANSGSSTPLGTPVWWMCGSPVSMSLFLGPAGSARHCPVHQCRIWLSFAPTTSKIPRGIPRVALPLSLEPWAQSTRHQTVCNAFLPSTNHPRPLPAARTSQKLCLPELQTTLQCCFQHWAWSFYPLCFHSTFTSILCSSNSGGSPDPAGSHHTPKFHKPLPVDFCCLPSYLAVFSFTLIACQRMNWHFSALHNSFLHRLWLPPSLGHLEAFISSQCVLSSGH